MRTPIGGSTVARACCRYRFFDMDFNDFSDFNVFSKSCCLFLVFDEPIITAEV